MVWDMFAAVDFFIHLAGRSAAPNLPDRLVKKKMNFSQAVELPPPDLVNKLSSGNLYRISERCKFFSGIYL
jgi:hypothetical protein